MTENKKQFDEILKALEEIKDTKEPKSKDFWDKMGVIGQLISGILLVALGLYVTLSIDKAQKSLAKQISDSQIQSSKDITDAQIKSSKDITEAQISTSKDIAQSQINSSKDIADLQSKSTKEVSAAQTETQKKIAASQVITSKNIADTQASTSQDIASTQAKSQEFAQKLNFDTLNRNLASDYLGKLILAPSANDRAALLDSLDIALPPKYALPMAIRFTRPINVKSKICRGEVVKSNDRELLDQNAVLSKSAISLLKRIKLVDTKLLNGITQSKYLSDAIVAEDILDIRTRIRFRISDLDDFADVYLNNKPIFSYKFGQDSGWVDITDLVKVNDRNDLFLQVKNDAFAGSGVRFEVQVGAEQYDHSVYRNDWTGNVPTFSIGLSISSDTNGKLHLNGDEIQVNLPEGQPHC